jgi:cytochrome c-type biogenesis protein CcmE
MDNTTNPKKSPIIVIVIICALAIVGFAVQKVAGNKMAEKSAEKYIEMATGGNAKVDIDDDKATLEMETEEGTVMISQDGSLPEDFPEDVQIYENGDVTAYVSMDSEEIKGFNVSFSTEDTKEEVESYYKEVLVDNGWEITTTVSSDVYVSLGAEKDTRTLALTVTTDDEETIGVITVQTE